MHIQPRPEMNQDQTTDAEPPAYRGTEKVVVMVEKSPEMDTAKEKVDK